MQASFGKFKMFDKYNIKIQKTFELAKQVLQSTLINLAIFV